MNSIKYILEHCKEILNLDLIEYKLISLHSANRVVYLIIDKYILKIMNKEDCWKENYYFTQYKKNEKYQNVVYYEKGKNYILYEYVENEKIKKIDKKVANNLISDIFKIIKKYKIVEAEGYGEIFHLKNNWKSFLVDEIEKRKKDILDEKKYIEANKFVSVLDKYKTEKRLLHGDLGEYNLLYSKGNINKIIDPTVIIGDYLYDLIFFAYSNIDLAENIEISDILKLTKEPYERVISYIYIILYIRISIEKRHKKDNRVKRFEKLWENFRKKEI